MKNKDVGSNASSHTILVVEDDEGLLYLIQKTLKKEGHSTKGASSGAEAIRWVMENPDGLVLLGYLLPDMTGKEVIETLAKKGYSVPFIIITGYGDEGVAVVMMKLGARDYLVKDHEFIDLLPSVVNQVVEQSGMEKKIRHAEKALRKNEERLRKFMDSATDSFALFDSKLNFIDINKRTETMFGLKKDKTVGKNILDISPGLKKEGVYDKYLEVIRTGTPLSLEDIVPHQKFGDIHLSIRAFKVGGGLGIITTDITERKKAEDETKRIMESYDRIIDNADEVIFRVKAEGGQVIYTNPAAERLLGYSQDEWLADPLLGFKIIHPDYAEKQKQIIEEINTAKKTIKNAVLGWITKDGREIIVEYTIIPVLDKEGKIIYFESIGRDITERKKAEEETRRLKEFNESIIEESPISIQVIDSDFVVRGWNKFSEDYLHIKREDIIGKKFFDVFPSLKKFGWDKVFRRVMESGEPYTEQGHKAVRTFGPHKGEILYHDIYIGPQREGGKIVGLIILLGDVTERKKAEEALQESRQLLQRTFDTIPEAIVVTDTNQNITSCNQSIQRVFGYTPDELIGKNYSILVPEEMIKDPLQKEREKELFEKGYLEQEEYYFKKKNGVTFHANFSVALLKDKEGNYQGMVGVVQDITERKKAQEAIKASAEKYRSLFEYANDSIFIVDPKTNRLLEVNKNAARRLGYTREELLQLTVDDIAPSIPSKRIKVILQELQKGKSSVIDSIHKRKNGTEMSVEISSRLIEYGGRKVIQSFIRDVTERKRAEEEMKRRLMKYRLEGGSLYLVKEPIPTLSIEAFKDLLKVGYAGVFISRTPEEKFKTNFDGNVRFLWISERGRKKSVPPDLKKIEHEIENISKGTAILIDRLDYLVFKNGFDETLGFVQRLRELAFLESHVIILSVDPSTLVKRELRLLEKEALEVMPMHKAELPEDLLETLRFIYKQNNLGVKPSYTDVRKELGISKPTTRKRIRRLISEGYLMGVLKGNRKVVELTEKGRILFFE